MVLRCLVFILCSILAVSVHGDVLETIRQQFEIYHRLPGEIEILATSDTEKIDDVLQRTETKRLAARKALDKTQTVGTQTAGAQTAGQSAATPKEDAPSPLFAEGYAAPFIHYAAVERAFARQSLQQGKPDEVMQSIQYVYHLADELSEAGPLELRTAAALVRLQTLEIVQALLLSPHCRRVHHEALHALFYRQASQVDEKAIWMRYREEGKQFFETTKVRGIDRTVSPNLLKELSGRPALDGYRRTSRTSAERLSYDQSVFLQTMSTVIGWCETPFYRRQPTLQQLNKEVKEQQGTTTEPVFALLLLRDVSETMRLFAQERTGNELAYLALSASLHGPPRRKMMNFLTGNEYEFPLMTGGIMCTYEGNIKPFYVPHR